MKMNRPWLSFYEEGVPHRLDIPRISLSTILDYSADRFPENPAVIFRDRSLTYREIRIRAAAVAAGLAEIGVRKGQRVAIMLPNCPQYIEVLFAILKIGGI